VTSIATGEPGVRIDSWLAKPDGDGPFPAVVLTHGCSGLDRDTSHQTIWRGLTRHAALLNENGYVTLIVDSFGPRRITDGCQTGLKYTSVQMEDAYAAFDHLASLPFVDVERIGFVGQSLGGSTALYLAQKYSVNLRTRQGLPTYEALVAYYPWCETSWAYTLVRPALILIGDKDDWTPASRCVPLDRVVDLVIYPDTHHSFDLPMRGTFAVEGMFGSVHTVAANDEARRDSQKRMLDFFDDYLGPVY
jgi:dienelactone hydrolase